MASNRITPVRLEIQFNERKPAYRSGRELLGWVVMDCHGCGVQIATKFSVDCLGFSEVVEAPSSALGGHRRMRRDHLSMQQNLLPNGQAMTLMESRRFDFRFRLPPDLPHSVECNDVGFVRYCCRAVVEQSSSSSSSTSSVSETVAYFSLIEEVDLNSPWVQQLCRAGESTSACAVERFSSNGSSRSAEKKKPDEMKASLVLSKPAYVPGENIDCTLSVHSAARRFIIEHPTIRLIQTVSAIGDSSSRISAARSQAIAESSAAAASTNEQQQQAPAAEHYWSNRCQLHIPGAVASSLLPLKFPRPLGVSYAVEFAYMAHGTPLKVACSVQIGTAPLHESTASGRQLLHPAAVEPALVEVCQCLVPDAEHPTASRRQRRSSSLIGQLLTPMGNQRRKSGVRAAPPIQYSLYCIYYPTISLIRKQKKGGLKSILKRHSVNDALDTALTVECVEGDEQQLQEATKRTSSISWYETPL